VLVSLHQVDFAFAYCPRTIALHASSVVYDGPTAMLSNDRLRQLYGAQSEELFTGSGNAPSTEVLLPQLQAA
jgi:phosphonate transport system ATP-binding protein